MIDKGDPGGEHPTSNGETWWKFMYINVDKLVHLYMVKHPDVIWKLPLTYDIHNPTAK